MFCSIFRKKSCKKVVKSCEILKVAVYLHQKTQTNKNANN